MSVLLKGAADELDVPCVAKVAMGSTSKIVDVKFVATFKKLSPNAFKEYVADVAETEKADSDVIRENIIEIKDMRGSDGEFIEYSIELLDAMLDQREYAAAMLEGFMKVNTGRGAAQLKNL